MHPKARSKAWFTYRSGALTVLKYNPLFKIKSLFYLHMAFVCVLALMIGLNPSNLAQLDAPIVTVAPPRYVHVNFLHPIMLALLAFVLFVLLIEILRKLRMQLQGRAIIFGSKKVWVRGLNGLKPLRWQDLRFDTKSDSKQTRPKSIKVSYGNKVVWLKNEDFHMYDLTYVFDAIAFTCPEQATALSA